jgi:hypothetical protein
VLRVLLAGCHFQPPLEILSPEPRGSCSFSGTQAFNRRLNFVLRRHPIGYVKCVNQDLELLWWKFDTRVQVFAFRRNLDKVLP